MLSCYVRKHEIFTETEPSRFGLIGRHDDVPTGFRIPWVPVEGGVTDDEVPF